MRTITPRLNIEEKLLQAGENVWFEISGEKPACQHLYLQQKTAEGED